MILAAWAQVCLGYVNIKLWVELKLCMCYSQLCWSLQLYFCWPEVCLQNSAVCDIGGLLILLLVQGLRRFLWHHGMTLKLEPTLDIVIKKVEKL